MIRFLHPRWIALHLLVAGLAFGTIYAGRWQWQVATRHHDVRNYAYSVQWYIFLCFGLWFWVKLMRDAAARTGADVAGRGPTPPAALTSSPPYRGYAMPQAASITVEDPELARYNAYLTGLAATSADEQPPAPAPDAGSVPARSEGRS